MGASFETFKEIRSFEIYNLTQKKPSCFNSMVRVRRYKVTVELVDEPKEVIQARIQKLYDETTNMHYREPLKVEAKKYGFELKNKYL